MRSSHSEVTKRPPVLVKNSALILFEPVLEHGAVESFSNAAWLSRRWKKKTPLGAGVGYRGEVCRLGTWMVYIRTNGSSLEPLAFRVRVGTAMACSLRLRRIVPVVVMVTMSYSLLIDSSVGVALTLSLPLPVRCGIRIR